MKGCDSVSHALNRHLELVNSLLCLIQLVILPGTICPLGDSDLLPAPLFPSSDRDVKEILLPLPPGFHDCYNCRLLWQ